MNRQQEKQTPYVLHRAPWVVPGLEPLIADGGVLCQNNKIVRVASFRELHQENRLVVDHEDCILIPALINGHVHLELSYLAELGGDTSCLPDGDITSWIRRLLRQRKSSLDINEISQAAYHTLQSLDQSGCVLVADIGNVMSSRFFSLDTPVDLLFFHEMMGISQVAQDLALRQLDELPDDLYCTGHALYSTGVQLLRRLKKRARRQNVCFPVHVAESIHEIEFLMSGSGLIRDFLQERAVWDGSFKPPAKGAVGWLDELKILDDKTICVHVVYVTDNEIAMLAKRRAKVCICPGSNRYMGVGRAPVEKFLAHGLLPALGTDSLASNLTLNIWREMSILCGDHPSLDPEIIFSMATRGGAEAFGMGDQYGVLAPGRSARFLAVHNVHKSAAADIFDFLVSGGETMEVRWIG